MYLCIFLRLYRFQHFSCHMTGYEYGSQLGIGYWIRLGWKLVGIGHSVSIVTSTSTSISISTSTSSSTSASSSCSQRMSRSPGLHSICVSITWNELRPAWPGNGKADEERVLYAKLSQTRLVCQRQMCSIDLSGHKNSPGNANGAGKLVMVLVMVMAFRKDDFQS